MANTTSEQLCFPSIDDLSVRTHFDGAVMSSDFGALLLAGIDRQLGLTQRLADAFSNQRHGSYTSHTSQKLLRQRIYQQTSGYGDGNDSNDLRIDPIFKLARLYSEGE